MDKKHELLSELKRITLELGRTPTVVEFRMYKQTKASHEGQFGTWAVFLQAAGVEPEKRHPREKIKYDDIQEVIGEYFEKKTPIDIRYPKILQMDSDLRILCIGDSHFPFASITCLSLLYYLAETFKPTIILQIGDLYDMLSHSKFPRSRMCFNPKEEMDLGRKMAEEMWKKLICLCPTAKCYQILGNHDLRPVKRMLEQYPEGEIFFTDSFNKKFMFEGVTTVLDPREELFLTPDIYAIHGYGALGHSRDQTHYNVIRGHDHKYGVTLKHLSNKLRWEVSVGYIGDPEAKALSYAPQKFINWHHGLTMITDWGPQFASAI